MILRITFFDKKLAIMNYNLQDFVSLLDDPRRGQGQRHSLENVLMIVVMAILSGHQGFRGFERFAKANSVELTEALKLKHGVPTYQTFHAVLTKLGSQLLGSKFASWVRVYHKDWPKEFIAVDGKSVKSTVHGGNSGLQNFTAAVTAFGQESGIVYGTEPFENRGKGGEVEALRRLIQDLGLQGRIFTMDAAHTKKNL